MKVSEKMLSNAACSDTNLIVIALKRNRCYEFAWIAIIIRT